jgi:hypothetical protein
VDPNEFGNRLLNVLSPRPALPAGIEVGPNLALPGSGKFSFQFQEELFVGKVGILQLHEFHRSTACAIRASERARDNETAPTDIFVYTDILPAPRCSHFFRALPKKSKIP